MVYNSSGMHEGGNMGSVHWLETYENFMINVV